MNEQNPLVRWIVRRIKEKNKNCIIIINGPTGSGKTFAGLDMALALAKELGTSFTLQDNMGFKFSDILKKTQLPQNRIPGGVFLFEEVGVIGGGAASREWQSKANAFFNSFMQTTRHKNQVFIMTCPLYTFLEKGTRALVHLQITMERIDYAKQESYGKPFINQTNVISGKTYMKYLRYKENGMGNKLRRVVFNLPSKEIVDCYEEIKIKYTDTLNKSILDADKPKETKPKRKIPYTIERDKSYAEKGISKQERANIYGISLRRLYEKLVESRKSGDIRQNPLGKQDFEGLRGSKPHF